MSNEESRGPREKEQEESGGGKREGKKKDAFEKENGCEANQRQMN